MANYLIENVFDRLKRLFSSDVQVRRIGPNKFKVIDTYNAQAMGMLATNYLSQKYTNLFTPGIFYSIMVASHMLALSLTKVAYMISLKRTSVIIGVIYGYVLFKEKNIRERLAGAIIMFIGFVMIVTAS